MASSTTNTAPLTGLQDLLPQEQHRGMPKPTEASATWRLPHDDAAGPALHCHSGSSRPPCRALSTSQASHSPQAQPAVAGTALVPPSTTAISDEIAADAIATVPDESAIPTRRSVVFGQRERERPLPPLPAASAASSTQAAVVPAARPPRRLPHLAAVFQHSSWKVLRGETPPRLNETLPLTLFFYADASVGRAIRKLARTPSTSTATLQRRAELVHRHQRRVLSTVRDIYCDIVPPSRRRDRAHRALLPAADRRELDSATFSEGVLFAAQALSAGLSVRGLEQASASLKNVAVPLCAAHAALRFAMRSRALTRPRPPYDDLAGVVSTYDSVWNAFEEAICTCYFQLAALRPPPPPDVLDTELLQILMSEAILHGLERGHIQREHLRDFDPSAIVAVPRLTLELALAGGLCGACDGRTVQPVLARWLGKKPSDLDALRERLSTYADEERAVLEKRLVIGSEDGGQSESPATPSRRRMASSRSVRSVFHAVCGLSDKLQRSRDFIRVMQSAFQMYADENGEN
ncbi:hypothetical protein HK405_007517 [Cladochytrium tenue]|nr:hypothetical protein HK405_007517 [Cladochytrium tenue]